MEHYLIICKFIQFINMDSKTNFQYLEHENSSAVVSFNNGTTFKVSKFMEQLNNFFRGSVLRDLSKNLSQIGLGSPPNDGGNWNIGVEAEILEPRSGEWKKGKVRMRVILEFCPDEPEEIKNDNVLQNNNSLDDIRQSIS